MKKSSGRKRPFVVEKLKSPALSGALALTVAAFGVACAERAQNNNTNPIIPSSPSAKAADSASAIQSSGSSQGSIPSVKAESMRPSDSGKGSSSSESNSGKGNKPIDLQKVENECESNQLAAFLYVRVMRPGTKEPYFAKAEDAKAVASKLAKALREKKEPINNQLMVDIINEQLEEMNKAQDKYVDLQANSNVTIVDMFQKNPEVILPKYLARLDETELNVVTAGKDAAGYVADTAKNFYEEGLKHPLRTYAEYCYDFQAIVDELANPDTTRGQMMLSANKVLAPVVLPVQGALGVAAEATIDATVATAGAVKDTAVPVYEEGIKHPLRTYGTAQAYKDAADELANPDTWHGQAMLKADDKVIQPVVRNVINPTVDAAKAVGGAIADRAMPVYEEGIKHPLKTYGTAQSYKDAADELANPDTWHGQAMLKTDQHVIQPVVRNVVNPTVDAAKAVGGAVKDTAMPVYEEGIKHPLQTYGSAQAYKDAADQLANPDTWHGQAMLKADQHVIQPTVQAGKAVGGAIADRAVPVYQEGILHPLKTYGTAQSYKDAADELANPDTWHGQAMLKTDQHVIQPVVRNVINPTVDAAKAVGGAVKDTAMPVYEEGIKHPLQTYGSAQSYKDAADELANPDTWHGKAMLKTDEYVIEPVKNAANDYVISPIKSAFSWLTGSHKPNRE